MDEKEVGKHAIVYFLADDIAKGIRLEGGGHVFRVNVLGSLGRHIFSFVHVHLGHNILHLIGLYHLLQHGAVMGR